MASPPRDPPAPALPADVYEPAQDTALLIGAVKAAPGQRVLEIGTGSGAVARHLARAGARVTATDVNPEALAFAKTAASREGLAIDFLLGDLFAPVRGTFDLVVFNPPYLPTGPEDRLEGPLNLALDGGPDGLAAARRFLGGLPAVLSLAGRAFVVVSTLSPWPAFEEALPPGWSARVVATDRFDFEEIRVVEVRNAPAAATRTGESRVPRGHRRALRRAAKWAPRPRPSRRQPSR